MRSLLLGCSQAKRRNAGPLAAVERYDGPLYKVLRKYLAEGRSPVEVWILSAEFGLIEGRSPIPWYDRRLTMDRALELRGQIEPRQWDCVSLGKLYLEALPERQQGLVLTGGIGQRAAALHQWLREE